jgi:hypothetical protein
MFYFDPVVQTAINNALKRIMGHENKEDARQDAYLAIADESPITIEDACACAVRAICRSNNRLRAESKRSLPPQMERGERFSQPGWLDTPSRVQREMDSGIECKNPKPYFNTADRQLIEAISQSHSRQ